MICPMILTTGANYCECKKDECAWWIPSKERGDCAVKELAMNAGDIGAAVDSIERLNETLNTISNKI